MRRLKASSKRFGLVGEPAILGLLLGIIIGIFAYAHGH